jgi:nucleotide-binding universal stress UspA family protein
MTEPAGPAFGRALRHFQAARARADLEQIAAKLRRQSVDLLPFEEVRRQIKGTVGDKAQLQEIPVDAIVGSVGRYHDFTRSFLPRKSQSGSRWANIELAFGEGKLPPIQVYQVGDAYFVLDGNHRVSVARDRGAGHIEAYVTPIKTRVGLSPDDDLDDILVKAELADFFEATELDQTRPDVDFTVTAPGRYVDFLHDIHQHEHPVGAGPGEGQPHQTSDLPAAAAKWCDSVYLPVIAEIERAGVLRAFPGRTAADLYAWLIRYRGEVEEVLGWQPDAQLALAKFVERYSPAPAYVLERAGQRLREQLLPGLLEGGPEPGRWRDHWRQTHRDDRLFSSILAGVDGTDRGWEAVEQAWRIALREEGRVHGLHVVALAVQTDDARARALRDEFDRRRVRVGVPGRLSIEQGTVEDRLVNRARWFDLTVLPLNHPPGDSSLARLGNGLRALLHHTPNPVLVVPDQAVDFSHALLAYDGSPKAQEALFVAAYLADRWNLRLTLTGVVGVRGVTTNTLYEAVDYLLSAGVPHAVVTLGAGSNSAASVGAALTHALDASQADLLIMGSYRRGPLREAVAGSAVDEILRRTESVPVLFCR